MAVARNAEAANATSHHVAIETAQLLSNKQAVKPRGLLASE
jgi:hypothetical protein